MWERGRQGKPLGRSHKESRMGALASFPYLLYDACSIAFLVDKTSGLSLTSTSSWKDGDNDWYLLWVNPAGSASTCLTLFGPHNNHEWFLLLTCRGTNWGSRFSSDLFKVTQLVRGNDLFLMRLHFPWVPNSDDLVIICFQRYDQNEKSPYHRPGHNWATLCCSC